MSKILIVEGNIQEDNQKLLDYGIETHSESLKKTISNYTKELEMDVFNPSSEKLDNKINELEKYDGLIWGGGSMHVYDDKPEIKKQIEFMKKCFEKIEKIFAICWGMQVAVTAAGGDVKRATNGTNIGISNNIELTDQGIMHPLYKDKPKKFNTPAYNYDEVVTLPKDTKHFSQQVSSDWFSRALLSLSDYQAAPHLDLLIRSLETPLPSGGFRESKCLVRTLYRSCQ